MLFERSSILPSTKTCQLPNALFSSNSKAKKISYVFPKNKFLMLKGGC